MEEIIEEKCGIDKFDKKNTSLYKNIQIESTIKTVEKLIKETMFK